MIRKPSTQHIRTYSPMAREALELMGLEIAAARKARKWSEDKLAERAGVSRGTVRRIEQGLPKTEVGVVFEIASLLAIPLFGDKRRERLASAREKAPLLPKRIHDITPEVNDDF
jgi:transcriptional regulator with XRE-family HTH domain